MPLNAGDYWVIAARPETPDQVVPWELAKNKASNGVRRFVAPLAIVRWINTGARIKGKVLRDCRKYFPPLNNITASDAASPNRKAPGFKAIANTAGMTVTAITVWSRTPHVTMPNLVIPQDELENLAAYILSLKRSAP